MFDTVGVGGEGEWEGRKKRCPRWLTLVVADVLKSIHSIYLERCVGLIGRCRIGIIDGGDDAL